MGIPVSDQDRALQFYVETLGFDKLMDEPLGQFGGRWIEVSPPRSSTITIALTPAREEAPAGVDTGIRFTTADAAALHTQLSASAVDVDELLRWEGIPPFRLPRPGRQHPLRQREPVLTGHFLVLGRSGSLDA